MSQVTEPPQVPPTNTSTKTSTTRVVVAAGAGNFVEWYDLSIYGFLAAILSPIFFPTGDPVVSLLLTLSVLALSFLARPIGAIVLGPIGDRVGRRKVLAWTIIIMSISTFLVGVIPTYDAIGILAPILLLTLRVIQGFSAGGEMGGATTLLGEYASPRRRGLMCSWTDSTSILAFVVSSGLIAVLTAVTSPDQMSEWGWRIPFLIGGPIGLIGIYLRFRVKETPEFETLKREESVSKKPLREMLKNQWAVALLAIGIVSLKAVGFWLILGYLPSFLTSRLEQHEIYLVLFMSLTLITVAIPVAGLISDRIGRQRLIYISCILSAALAVPGFVLLSMPDVWSSLGGLLLIGLPISLLCGGINASIIELFPARVRFSGFAIPYNIGVAIFGGGTPLVVTAIVSSTGDTNVGGYALILTAALTLASSAAAVGLRRRTHTVQ